MQNELHLQPGSRATGLSSIVRLFALLLLALGSTSCGSTRSKATDSIPLGSYYTQFSLRVHKNRCASTNFRGTSSELLPINTLVEYVGTHRRSLKMQFPDGREFTFTHVAKHTRDSIDESFAKFFGPEQMDLSAFSAEEQEHIQLGTVSNGMSRAAVLASMGPPPASLTASLEFSVWTYSRTKFFSNTQVNFDAAGLVIGAGQ